MKNIGSNLGRGVIFAAFLLAFSLLRASAQTADLTSDEQSEAATRSQAPRIPVRVTQTVDDSNRFTLKGNVHPMARTQFDRGAVVDSQPASHVALALKRSDEQEAALRQLLDQQQDKTSPNYHKWLTPDQFGKQFGPADTDIQAVTDWLTSRGFTNVKVSPGRTRVEFSGNIGQVQNAFQTQIHHYMVNGAMHMANVSDPQIPAALAPVVRGVAHLNDFRPRSQAHRLGTFRRSKDTGEVKPLFTFNGCGSGTTTQPCYAVGPGDFAKIYGAPATINSALPGTGVTIAIVQDSNINVADVTQFRSLFGLPATFSTANIILNGPDPGIQGPDSATDDEIEADLDVQWAGAVAPGATVDLVVSEDSESVGMFGTDLSAIYIVDNNFAPILSESFGVCEASIGASAEAIYVDLWQQAAAQGITAILSSGDSGSAGCDPTSTAANPDVATQGIAVSGLASTAYNVALGGTDFQNNIQANGTSQFWNATNGSNGSLTQTSAKGYIPEATWNDSCASSATSSNLTTCTSAIINADSGANSPNLGIDLVAAGGGPSNLNAKPSFQSGITGMPSANFRQVPDISLFSGNGFNGSFYVICQQDANSAQGGNNSSCNLTNDNFLDFQGVGGTSAAAPAFAGIMAMVIQKNSLARQGNANYVLYQLYKNNAAGTICASAASPAASCTFYDTVAGNNSVACAGGSTNCSNTSTAANQYGVLIDPTHANTPAFTTTTGYDNATGLGSVNINNLVTAWSSVGFMTDTVTLTGPSGTVSHGTNQTFHISVNPTMATGSVALVATPPSGTPVGIGSFSENTAITLSSGLATINTNQLPGGVGVQVVASYSGDGTYRSKTSAPVTLTVTPETSSTAVGFVTFPGGNPSVSKTAASVQYGSSYILQIAVSDSAGSQCASVISACPTGTVTLTDNGQPLKDFSGTNSSKLNSQGIAEDQPVQLATGTHSLVAAYSGDNSFNASTSPAEAVTITAATTTIGVAAAPASNINTTTPVTLTAKVNTTSSGAGPTGTIIFKANGTQIGNAVQVVPTAAANLNSPSPLIPAFATATITHTFDTTGAVTITAAYTGDTNYSSGSGSGSITVVSTGSVPTTTALTTSATTLNSGGNVTLTAKVTSSTNNGPGVTGTVQFMSGTTALGSPVACTATAGTSTAPATCSAMLMTALSSAPPSVGSPSNRRPEVPVAPLTFVSSVLAMLLSLSFGRTGVPARRRLVYAFACVLAMAGIAAGIAGCGGSTSSNSGGGSPTTHVDSITAVYGGDSTYIGSTSAATGVTVS
ncbi:MAG TPA: Ig-like domain repeat protein, partial [Candidatus Acidoferrum sp.]